jgi:hypothetical protein
MGHYKEPSGPILASLADDEPIAVRCEEGRHNVARLLWRQLEEGGLGPWALLDPHEDRASAGKLRPRGQPDHFKGTTWKGPRTGTGFYLEWYAEPDGRHHYYMRKVCKCVRGKRASKLSLEKLAMLPVRFEDGQAVVYV